jgi:hypothetical protein
MVMLSDPFGSPLTVEVRGVPGVFVPGSSRTRSSASREVNGMSVICRPVIVVPTVADCVCSSSPPPPVIVTVSPTLPTSRPTLMVEGVPTLTFTSCTTDFLKLEAVTVTV